MPPARSRMHLLAVPAVLLTCLGTAVSAIVLQPASVGLGCGIVALLAIGYARMSLIATASCLGVAGTGTADRRDRSPRGRTALLVPIYNETPDPVAAAVAVMAAALRPADNVAIFILSDTQDPALIAAETLAFAASRLTAGGIWIHYRRRSVNTGRKAGNIAEFCHNAGHVFDYAIVLDADSLMTGDAIRGLIGELAHDDRCALVQSVTYPVGAGTLFGRMQQFAARLNTPLTVAGQHRWQRRRGTFWGHNAIIRLDAFRTHACLPVLPGSPPMGGEILCHDTIEAALLLGAGWEVRAAPAITGSYETTPSNLIDHLARERRWCQGNLQHLRLIAAPGFTIESRLHILIGILHYLSAPAGLLLTVILLFAPRSGGEMPPHLVAISTWLTSLLLFGPRLASLCRALVLGGAAAHFGGRLRLVASAVIEQLSTVLTAPIFIVSVSAFIVATLRGRVVRWDAPARGDRSIGWHEAWHRFRWHTIAGLAAVMAAYLLRPAALAWVLPLSMGLVVSVPLAVASGSAQLGALSRRLGLFETEDERSPSAELAGLQAHRPDLAHFRSAAE